MAALFRSIYAPGLFRGKTAIVTGGGTGIGFAIARELKSLGCLVIIASRNEDRILEGVRRLNEDVKEGEAHAFRCNLRREAEVSACPRTLRVLYPSTPSGAQVLVCDGAHPKLTPWAERARVPA